MTTNATTSRIKTPELAPRLSALHFPALDGLRGLAIILVLFCHYVPLADIATASPFLRIFQAGWIGVDLFFVLSGFLITGILLDAKTAPHFFRNFYMRRTLRIFPLYYGVLIVYLVLVPFFLHHFASVRAKLPVISPKIEDLAHLRAWFFLYAQNIRGIFINTNTYFFVHFWSLAVEEQFYLLWPAIIYFASRRAVPRICLGIIIGSLLLRILLLIVFPRNIAVYIALPCRGDSLALGGLLAYVVRLPGGLSRGVVHVRLITMALGTMIVLYTLYVCFYPNGSRHVFTLDQINDQFVRSFGFTILALFFCGLLYLCLDPASTTRHLFELPPLRFIGKYSYGIYVFHLLFPSGKIASIEVLQHHMPIFLAACVHVIAAGAIATGIAMISYHAYEKPFLGLKRYFEYRPATPPAATVTEIADAKRVGGSPV